MALPVIPIVSGLIELGKGWFSHKKKKTEAKRDVEIKQIQLKGEADVASASDMKTSWKDEYLTVLFSVPLIVVFYSAVWGEAEDIQRVNDAFAAMQQLPEWYMWSIVGIVAGTFGLRALSKGFSK